MGHPSRDVSPSTMQLLWHTGTCDDTAVVDHDVARHAVALVAAHRVGTELAAGSPLLALVHIHTGIAII